VLRFFLSQKTKQPIKKLELTQIRNNFQEKINQNYQDMSVNLKMYGLEERIKNKGCKLKNYQQFGETNFKVPFTWMIK
jgi:hypothetical protein